MRLIFLFLIFPVILFSQNEIIKKSYDFIIHEISEDDTYHSLKLKYGISKRKIIKSNPELKKCKFLSDCPEVIKIKIFITDKNLFVKDFLKDSITINTSLEEKENLNNLDSLTKFNIDTFNIDTFNIDTFNIDTFNIDTFNIDTLIFQKIDSIVDVAIFFPFFSNTRDSIVTNTSRKKLNHTSFLPKSKISMNLYSGLLFAFHDFLKDTNITLNLNVFDTYNDIDTIKKILATNDLDSMDLIFGPLYQKNFDFMASSITNPSTIIVSPLQSNSISKKYNNNVYFFESDINKKTSFTASYIFNKFLKDKNSLFKISIFLKEEEEEIKSLVSSSLKEWNDNINYYEIEKSTISEEMSEKEINAISDIVFIPSNDRVFVSDLISRLHALQDTSMIVFCHEGITNFELTDHSELYDLNVHFFSEKNKFCKNKEFIKSFFKYFSINPQAPYVQKGYKCGVYFLNLFLGNYIHSNEINILGTYYKFILQANNIYRNEAFKLWKYDKYNIKEVLDFNENQ